MASRMLPTFWSPSIADSVSSMMSFHFKNVHRTVITAEQIGDGPPIDAVALVLEGLDLQEVVAETLVLRQGLDPLPRRGRRPVEHVATSEGRSERRVVDVCYPCGDAVAPLPQDRMRG